MQLIPGCCTNESQHSKTQSHTTVLTVVLEEWSNVRFKKLGILSILGLFAFPSLNGFGVSRCWMKDTQKALLAHYFTTMTVLVILVSSGILMLFLVYRKIHRRDEWSQNRVAFLSIWGLSCLFGITWGLTFLDFGPLSVFVLFLSCILNSFQGLYLQYTVPV